VKVDKTVSEIIAPLREKRELLQEEIDQLMIRIASLREEQAIIDRILRAANGTRPGPKSTRQTGRRAKQPLVVTPAIIRHAETILGLMKDRPKKPDWTASELVNELGLANGTVNSSLRYMREEEMIRPTRGVRGGGHAYAPWE
jgi:hypothetical protein